ncbi:hypothetical protein DL95DRAFT_520260 [Leptodontidium sp. 2 PMI_412]|nr:hypothetical protein DL95DRAFT_520260 [Leptodontidium sp. 2 PMI_412]
MPDPYISATAAPTSYNGKVILITGASRGIGRATAISNARSGASSASMGRSQMSVLRSTFFSPAALKSTSRPSQFGSYELEYFLGRVWVWVWMVDVVGSSSWMGV